MHTICSTYVLICQWRIDDFCKNGVNPVTATLVKDKQREDLRVAGNRKGKFAYL
jgi:hypothetical protein